MAKNRRYSNYNSSRGRSKKRENPLVIGPVVLGSVLLAAMCGRTLDARYEQSASTVSGREVVNLASESDRAGLRIEPGKDIESKPPQDSSKPSSEVADRVGVQDEGNVLAAIKEIERVSGVDGESPLSPERWVTDTPLLLGTVDVSGMLAQELTLKRSLQNGYLPRSVSINGTFSRAGSYLDLLFKDEKGAAQIVRFDRDAISVVYRSPSGIEVEREKSAFPVAQELAKGSGECAALRLTISPDSSQPSSVVCASQGGAPLAAVPVLQERVVMTLPVLPVRSRFVSVATNLVKGELQELTVIGDIRGSVVEDKV